LIKSDPEVDHQAIDQNENEKDLILHLLLDPDLLEDTKTDEREV